VRLTYALIPSLLLGLAFFGTAPGLLLRLIVRVYPMSHPRRRELVAELYQVESSRRPLFVAQQLELAISEGIPSRWKSWRSAKAVASPESEGPLSSDRPLVSTFTEGYRGPQVCSIVGITYRQLDYWARTGLIRPSVADTRGVGTHRLYSYKDLVEAKVIKTFLDAGMALQKARQAIEYLRDQLGEDIGSPSLVLTGADPVLLARDSDQLLDLVREGQGVLSIIPLDGVKAELDAAITELRPPETE
jgi:DNA-binding transcriptional MerR regulator